MTKHVVHVVAAVLVIGPLALAYLAPDRYAPLMEEDRAVEWATVALFLTAGVVRLSHAIRTRRGFDALVGLFCLFVAGEEISWGQRLIGYTPPDVFLEHNTQQEANVHNFTDIFGRPKWMLIMALVGYGLVLPALARPTWPRRVLARVGATAPAAAIAPWFLVAVALLIWYPVTFTGEWVELHAGWLFVVASPLSPSAAGLTAAAALPAAFAMTWVSASRRPDDRAIVCARAEVDALLQDIERGDAATSGLDEMGSVHKRVWSAVASGYVDGSRLERFRAAPCANGASSESLASRRRYGVDPWGTAYWMAVTREPEAESQRVVVYSFGPNRRRDGEPGETTGDDISAAGVLR